MIDEFIVFIMPLVLGKGISLFSKDNQELSVVLKEVKSYPSGVVQVSYQRNIRL